MQQFFLDQSLVLGQFIQLPAEVAYQLLRVLRYRGGEQIRLVDMEGLVFLAQVEIRKKEVWAQPLEALTEEKELDRPLILAAGRIKRDHWEWLLQKACELGVSRIIPLTSDRVNEKPFNAHQKERQERILREAAEQSERQRIPILDLDQTLPQVLERAQEEDLAAVVLLERSEKKSPSLLELPLHGKGVLCIVGPEGGFSPEEREVLGQSSIASVSLGPRILRAETAAILAIGLLAQKMGETRR